MAVFTREDICSIEHIRMPTQDDRDGMRHFRIDTAEHIEGAVATQRLIGEQFIPQTETAAGFISRKHQISPLDMPEKDKFRFGSE